VFDVVAFGQVRAGAPAVYATDYTWDQFGLRLLETAWFVVLAYVVAAAYGVRVIRRGLRTPAGMVAAFCLLTVAYIMLIGNMAEVGENNRFQFIADPLMLALLAAALSQLPKLPRRWS
jgi:hypothetical protein